MPGIPIPDDWNEPVDGFACAFLCVPNSPLWRAVVYGAIYDLSRGWTWDETTGTITDVQSVAKEILESLCMATCEDLITAIEGANTAELAKAVKELTTYLSGQNRNIENPLPDLADYTGVGLDAQLSAINTVLQSHIDNIDELEEIQQEVARALAGVVVPVVTP